MLTAIVLAAGESQRMGSPKALLKIGEQTFLGKILCDLKGAGAGKILAVLGAYAEDIRSVVDLSGVTALFNPEYKSGQLSSLWAALRQLPPETRGVLFTLVDHPGVALETYRQLIAAWEENPEAIIIPEYGGRGGHPVIFPAALAGEFLAAPPSQGARFVIYHHPELVKKIPVSDPGVRKDIDTPEDYQNFTGGKHAGI